jgi:hypothetical protein
MRVARRFNLNLNQKTLILYEGCKKNESFSSILLGYGPKSSRSPESVWMASPLLPPGTTQLACRHGSAGLAALPSFP